MNNTILFLMNSTAWKPNYILFVKSTSIYVTAFHALKPMFYFPQNDEKNIGENNFINKFKI